MELAILFWFYKEPKICLNRLKIIRKYNPKIKIFGLFGGNKEDENKHRELLSEYLGDFYTSAETDSDWKWINGDLVLLEWYENRGKKLDWDSIAIVQWDMLVFTDIKEYFGEISKNDIFLSGFKPLDKKTENSWDWTRPDGTERNNYLSFLKHVEKQYGYNKQPVCCLFIFEVFPRIFFEKYSNVKNVELGMLEYKVPIYSEIFNLNFLEKDLGIYWGQKQLNELPMNAMSYEIGSEFIKRELEKPNGWRIFHPYNKVWGEKSIK